LGDDDESGCGSENDILINIDADAEELDREEEEEAAGGSRKLVGSWRSQVYRRGYSHFRLSPLYSLVVERDGWWVTLPLSPLEAHLCRGVRLHLEARLCQEDSPRL